MNDDELIERLRRTLAERAGSLQPAPLVEPGGPSAGADPVSGELPPRVRAANPFDQAPEGRRTAEYMLLPPTGPVPVIGGRRPRWRPLVGAGALVAAAAATVAALVVTGSHHPVTVGPARSSAPTAAPVPTTGAAGAQPAASATTSPPTTVVPAGPTPVAAGFEPVSVTFVSPELGWVLGVTPGASGSCARLARTTDGGRDWAAAAAPSISGSCPTSGSDPATAGAATPAAPVLRFADDRNGWIYTGPGGGGASRLWSTHDGGTTWSEVPVPQPGGVISSLEASGGRVDMVVEGPCPAASAGQAGCQGQVTEQIFSSPVGADAWSASAYRPATGAGPELTSDLVRWGRLGWLIDSNRTVVSGAQNPGVAGWSRWNPPCATANGPGLVTAASPTDLVAVCAEGTWGTPDPSTSAHQTWLFVSGDGGQTFHVAGPVPGDQPQDVTVAPGQPRTIVVADQQRGLLVSLDGGASWMTAEPGLAAGSAAVPGNDFTYVGFTTATQGVAIRTAPAATLFMTRDGGLSWSPVSF